jgi:hypothetical protein
MTFVIALLRHSHFISQIFDLYYPWPYTRMKQLLEYNKTDLALVIGNGINRYGAAEGMNSWEALLTKLARRHINPEHTRVPKGVSPTEFYDVLELAAARAKSGKSLQSQFCEQMSTWMSLPQHEHVAHWAKRESVPILTTNFEETLSTPVSAKRSRCGKDKFTAFYPWSTCFSVKPVVDPLATFAVWHMNGIQAYRQSIRLGLSHYMGSVERARAWLHKSGNRLFGSEDISMWPGSKTWLQVFFHKPLLFFGLGLEENEVFLRWLLIERARYFKKFPGRAKQGWYVYAQQEANLDPGKSLFLKGVGIEPYPVATYDDIYAQEIW